MATILTLLITFVVLVLVLAKLVHPQPTVSPAKLAFGMELSVVRNVPMATMLIRVTRVALFATVVV